MNITDLVERCLEDSIEKYGKDDSIVKMCKDCMTFFGYKVLEEINRLNFTALTIIDDNDFSELHATLKGGGFLFSLQRLNLHNQLTSNRLCSD